MRRALTALAAALLASLWSSWARAADFVGPETCKQCHAAAYEAWKDSGHARAQTTLPEKQRKDSRCTTCHAPESDKGLSGITCESCHGAGSIYAPRYVMRDKEISRAVGLVEQSEKQCLACHTEATPALAAFEWKRKKALIEHWEKERAARGALKKLGEAPQDGIHGTWAASANAEPRAP
jgi:hypothetical protein